MAQKISRKAKGVRRQAREQGAKRKVRKVQANANSVFGRMLRLLPFTEEQLQRAFMVLILAGALVLAWFIASMSGATALAEARIATMASNAGYEVRRVEIRGAERIDKLKIYERTLGQRDQSMTLVDLHGLRSSLMELSWVEDARVARQLPDGLVVDIVERTPHAVLRRPDRLVLIDPDGHELEPISTEAAKDMLKIEGPGAQAQVAALAHLLDAAPALKPRVSSAEWVGNRRWDIIFDTDQELALPQGEDRAAGALISFARLDGVNRLLGGKVLAFDMRSPERIYLRCPDCGDDQSLDTGEGS